MARFSSDRRACSSSYYREEDKTAEALTADGFIKTGDAGYIEPDGQLKIIDRAKDVGRLASGQLFAPKYIENKLKFFPNIKEAVAIGQDRDHVVALLNIELASVGNWAERNNVSYGSYQELAGNPRVYEMVEAHVDEVNRALASEPVMAGAQIKRFLILPKELDADDGELTRTQKVRRGLIAERYASLVAGLYDGSAEASISTEITYEDGRKGMLNGSARIVEMTLHPPVAAARAGRMSNAARRGPPVRRTGLAVLWRRQGDPRGVLRHRQGGNPRDHRAERRRQDVDAECRERVLSPAARAHHLSRQDPCGDEAL